MDTNFVAWLTGEMDKRDWNNTDLARRAGVVPSTVSMIISGHKRPGLDFCKGVARAFSVSPEYVLRLAGHLPPQPDTNPSEQIRRKLGKIAEIVDHLPPDIQAETMDKIIALIQVCTRTNYPKKEKEKELT